MSKPNTGSRTVELPDIPALEGLKRRPQWVAWARETRNGRSVKIPVNPLTGANAASDDPRTWGTYAQACKCARTRRLAGIGYMFGADDDVSGFDLDGCIGSDGRLEPWAAEVVALQETYAERSPSGRGIHFIARGKLPKAIVSAPAGVEAYSSGRYFAMTGDHIEGTPTEIGPAPKTLAMLQERVAALKPPPKERPKSQSGGETFFGRVNSLALGNLGSWVPMIFGADAEPQGNGGFRVSSAALGRELQEALSLHPTGIKDWGVADMGDEREGKRTAIDIVIEHGADVVTDIGQEPDAMTAARWLCEQLDVDPGELERPNAANEFSDIFSDVVASLPAHWARMLFGLPDATPSPPTQPGAKADGKAAAWQWRFFGRQEDIVVRSYLVDKLLPETGVGLISGQWGTYKTFVAVDLAAAVITRSAFAGFDVVRRGGVLFIAMEGQEEVDIRTRAALTHRGFSDVLAPFAWIDTAPRFLDRGAGQKLAAMVAEGAKRMQRDFGVPPVLVIVDTAGKAAGYEKAGDENDSVLGRQIVAAMAEASRKTGALFIGVDHFGKSAETGTRGSSAKEADCDVVLALLGEKGVGGRVTNPRLAIRKRRSGPNGVEIPFKPHIVAVGDEGETTLVVNWVQADQVAPSPKPDKWSKSLIQLQQAMTTVLADNAVELQPVAGGLDVQAVDYELVRSEFYAIYPAHGTEQQRAAAKRKAFNRAVTDAQGKSLIGVRDTGAMTFMWFA